jgi:putative nucleotidyltransferase with HDIG domain
MVKKNISDNNKLGREKLQKKILFISAEKAFAFSVLIFLFITGISWIISIPLNNYFINSSRQKILVDAHHYESFFSNNIDTRFALIESLEAYIKSEIETNHEINEEEFVIFASGLYGSTKSIINFTIFPNGISKFVYPLKFKDTLTGNDIINDPRPNVRTDIKRAIETGKITVSDPYELKQGGLGIVSRKAIYDKSNNFWGLCSMVLDVPALIEESGISDKNNYLSFSIKDSSGKLFFGEQKVFDNQPVIFDINLPEGSWKLAVIPKNGWFSTIRTQVTFFWITAVTIALFFAIIFYLIYSRHTSLTVEVQIKTEEIKENLDKIKRTFEQIIVTLSQLVEIGDPYTSGHQKKVAAIAVAISTRMGLDSQIIEAIRIAALLHDIGKISIPTSILSKPGVLTKVERDLLETHPRSGYEIIKEIDFPYKVAQIILQHHERINGSGYPNRLAGSEIMIEAKIIAAADVFEAMASHRPYRPALDLKIALNELEVNKGILYDVKTVDALLSFIDSYYKIVPGTHLSLIYDDFNAQISYIAFLFDLGFKENYRCIYIVNENSVDTIINSFKAWGMNITFFIEKEQMLFLSSNETYLENGYFDPDRMIAFLKKAEKAAIKEGYEGIKVAGEMTWILSGLPGTEKFSEYDDKFNKFIPESRIIAFCMYNELKFDKGILIEAILAHPKIGINGLFYDNPFYGKKPKAGEVRPFDADYKKAQENYNFLKEKIKSSQTSK